MRDIGLKRFSICVLLIFALIGFTSQAMAADVSQGKCTSYNKESKTITIEEYNLNFGKKTPYGEPTGVVNQYNVANAIIGITPEAGDILRIAYDVNGTDRIAIKVMNVSKQDLRKK